MSLSKLFPTNRRRGSRRGDNGGPPHVVGVILSGVKPYPIFYIPPTQLSRHFHPPTAEKSREKTHGLKDNPATVIREGISLVVEKKALNFAF